MKRSSDSYSITLSKCFKHISDAAMMNIGCLFVLATVGWSSASSTYWAKNINYRSPSEHHPSLGISIHKVVKRNDPQSPWDPTELNFTHGVASGDPFPESVILWTRISPTSDNDQSNITVSGYVPLYNHETQQYVAVSKAPVCVDYTVASDKNFTTVVDSGTAYTSSDVDFTVKVIYEIAFYGTNFTHCLFLRY